ncbi:hypothetical protein [Microcoleus sp. herbarium12]|uniref:hypothetical protein n=1 Tax=Microcoleus sp. herbarium12 TaxID=3055437 RepID=UPI002FD403FA
MNAFQESNHASQSLEGLSSQFAQSHSAINTVDWEYSRNADRSHYDLRNGNNPDGVNYRTPTLAGMVWA